MTTAQAPTAYRSYAATRQHGTALIEPSWAEFPQKFAANRRLLDDSDVEFAGTALNQLRSEARQELFAAAKRYTSEYRDVRLAHDVNATTASHLPIVMAGHQPELFHPGVWFKNFALSRLGVLLDAIPINLVVDNDLCGATSIRVPSRDGNSLLRKAIPFDEPVATPVPFEQRWLQSHDTFKSFSTRLSKALPNRLSHAPCIEDLWPQALKAVERCGNIACAIAQSRHALEGQIGLDTLEVPLSALCRTRSFSAFALSLLGHLPRLHECYNDSLYEYRIAHGIRSQAHPVPELRQEGDWFEAPLWLYGDDDPVRRPVWARFVNGVLEISDRHTRTVSIDQAFDSPAAADQLFALAGPSFKLRPRALVTTMYARLILSDLFLHGIGGAKYDQLGDQITRRFFGLPAPSYGVLSATVLLPQAHGDQPRRSERQIIQALRDTTFSPERFAEVAVMDGNLIDEKRQLLDNIPPRGQRLRWHHQVVQLNRRLAASLKQVRGELTAELQQHREWKRESQIWTSREHPFIIFPLEYLTETFDGLLP